MVVFLTRRIPPARLANNHRGYVLSGVIEVRLASVQVAAAPFERSPTQSLATWPLRRLAVGTAHAVRVPRGIPQGQAPYRVESQHRRDERVESPRRSLG